MGRTPKKDKAKKGSHIFEDDATGEVDEEGDLPKDEAGRRKIKRQYEDLLGIRVQKLKGRILNRERINKTIEGVYFICAECKKVCHNMDEGLVEDPENIRNLCGACGKAKAKGKQAAAYRRSARRRRAAGRASGSAARNLRSTAVKSAGSALRISSDLPLSGCTTTSRVACRRCRASCGRAAPYSRSPMTAWPIEARCTRI